MGLLEYILIGAIAFFTLMVAIAFALLFSKLNQIAGQLGAHATSLQAGVDEKFKRLQSRTEPLLEETHRLMTSRAEPLLDEAQKFIVAARPTLEQINTLLAATTPVLAEAHAAVQLAKESAALTKAAAATIKLEAESCMAAISATTTELTKMTKDEAESVRQLVAHTRERAELQVQRVDQLVTTTTNRLDETAEMVQTGVLKPVTEIAAVLAAVQRFLQVLFAQERKPIDKAYHDEEMFI